MRNYRVAIFLFLASCDTYEFPKSPYPRLDTKPIVTVTEAEVVFEGSITYVGEKEITNHGFVWGKTERPSTEGLEGRINLGLFKGSQDQIFKSSLKAGLIKDQVYFVQTFAQTATHIIYGKPVSFISPGSNPPTINLIQPNDGNWGDTVAIRGNYFGFDIKTNKVFFGTTESKLISSTDSSLYCIVPSGISEKSVFVTLSVVGRSTQSKMPFLFLSPMIDSFIPTSATFNDIVTIKGKNFSPVKSRNLVMFNSRAAEVIEASRSQLKVKVPLNLTEKEATLKVAVDLQTGQSQEKFQLLGPEIQAISNVDGYYEDTITITGKNFHPLTVANEIFFGDLKGNILESSTTSIVAKVPFGVYANRDFLVKIKTGENSSSFKFSLLDDFISKPNQIGKNVFFQSTFSIGNFGYAGMGFNSTGLLREFWEFDPVTGQWNSLPDFPAEPRNNPISFAVGDYAYVGGGFTSIDSLKDFWRYHAASRSWLRLNDLPVGLAGISMASVNKGHVVLARDEVNFWSYDPTTDSWQQGQDHPFKRTPTDDLEIFGFSVNDEIGIYVNNGFLSVNFSFMNTSGTVWESGDSPLDFRSFGSSFVISPFVYIDNQDYLVKFDSQSRSFSKLYKFPLAGFLNGFAINGLIYTWYNGHFWEFNPKYSRDFE